MSMSIYAAMYAQSLDKYIAKKKKIEEKSKESNKTESKLGSELKLTNPGQSFSVKDLNVEKAGKSIIYVNAQARTNQARRG